jgi:hypothetical protein
MIILFCWILSIVLVSLVPFILLLLFNFFRFVLIMDKVILVREIEAEINSFRVSNLHLKLLLRLRILFVILFKFKAKQSISLGDFLSSLVFNVNVSLQLILSPKSHIAFVLAILIWADVMGSGKVSLEVKVGIVVNVLEYVSAQVACEMHSTKMVKEQLVIEVILLAEIAPWMRQDFCLLLRAHISKLDMVLQIFDIVKLLLSNEDKPSFNTDPTESLLVVSFQMGLQRFLIVELVILLRASVDHAR